MGFAELESNDFDTQRDVEYWKNLLAQHDAGLKVVAGAHTKSNFNLVRHGFRSDGLQQLLTTMLCSIMSDLTMIANTLPD